MSPTLVAHPIHPALDLVGDTPLIEIARLAPLPTGVRLFAKAEFLNPSGSVKDRAARAMLLEGLASGALRPGKTIVDATSGNTGIALAMMGAALGYPVRLFLPANASPERKQIMRSFGADIIETDPLEGCDGAYTAVQQAVASVPELFFYPDQYNNPANPAAHESGTAQEIWEQSGGAVTHFVAAMGTSGTFTGTARGLKAEDSTIQTIAVQPDSPWHGIEGTKHMASTLAPGIMDVSLHDAVERISTTEAYETTRRLARVEGLLVGVSSGANVAAALKVAARQPPGSLVVTILCDTGSRYLSDPFWNEAAS
jgi:cysteine synthase B